MLRVGYQEDDLTVHLVPMSEAEFTEYVDILIRDYAKDNVEAGYWDPSDAVERSRKQTMDLLPEGSGLKTTISM